MAKIQVTQVKSKIGTLANHKATLRTLGLKKIGDSVVKENTPEVQGMVRAVAHLVRVEEVK
ncbi:MAG: 50S ribosomal protein L30 [Propionibacteriaceae bacterium]|jgi:large subunit ribosomal protein L30|nr:50S ribosomal protein L30 [Propionibacteriaceae bacterium]